MTSETRIEGKTAVLVLGCPQVPVQTGIALYLMSILRKKGVRAVVAGNRAARLLVEVSDPERHYVGEVMDIDRYIDEIADKKRSFDYHFIFIHNDAGVSYAATVQSLTGTTVIALIYGEHFQEMADLIEFPCEKIAAKAVHNPMPLKNKLDEVLPWVVSNL
ncbi:MAG: DUF1890 domain-containing protein [Methanoregulaceae archaeon]|nr:DUF1890 domain-containing protein [Methanoregulaceae archaeon]